MMKRIYTALFLSVFFRCFISEVQLSAQTTLQGTVHFKKDRFSLPETELTVLQSLTDTILPENVERIVIKGYTDSDADSAYNAKLSLDRCNTVRSFFIDNGFDSSKCHIAAFGEYFPIVANADENSKSKNRRVEIFITMKTKLPDKPCSGDTLIEVSEGVFIAMSKCFPDGGPCIHPTVTRREQHDLKRGVIRKLFHPEDPFSKNRISISYYVELNCDKGSNCTGNKVTIYVPTYDVKGKEIETQQYDSATAELKKVKSVRIRSLKKKKYATTETACQGKPGAYTIIKCGTRNDGDNCSCDPVTLVFKKGIKVDSVKSFCGSRTEISSDSTTVSFYPYFGLSALVVTNGTDTFHLHNIELTALHHGLKRMRICGDKKYHLRWSKKYKCAYFRKYKFRSADIDLQKRKPWMKHDENNMH